MNWFFESELWEKMMAIIRAILSISILKTIVFNLYYFGVGGVKLPVLLARQVKIRTLSGKVTVRSYRTGNVKIGFGTVGVIDPKFQRSIWENSGTICFGENVFLGYGTRISNAGVLELGNNFKVSANTIIMCKKNITFGNDVLVSWGCTVTDTDWHQIIDQKGAILNPDEEVQIGEHVWIGSNVMVLKGSVIQQNSVIAAGSMVTKKFAESNVIIGQTNCILKRDINWQK